MHSAEANPDEASLKMRTGCLENSACIRDQACEIFIVPMTDASELRVVSVFAGGRVRQD